MCLAFAAAAVMLAATLVHDSTAPSPTFLTGLAWDAGVPNPFVRGGVAFNLADVAIAVGDALLVGGALFHAWTNRGRLREPV